MPKKANFKLSESSLNNLRKHIQNNCDGEVSFSLLENRNDSFEAGINQLLELGELFLCEKQHCYLLRGG